MTGGQRAYRRWRMAIPVRTPQPLILVIDAGTTSVRAMLFDQAGRCLAVEGRAVHATHPAPGWVEQDADAIWADTLHVLQSVAKAAHRLGRIACVGITNQRETVAFWDRDTGASLAPAIVWQDRRTADVCSAMIAAGHEPMVNDRTGLWLDPYFSATKMGWALRHHSMLRAAGKRLAMGTIDAFLIHRLTGGAMITDVTNASRTALMALDVQPARWDAALAGLFDVDTAALPAIGPTTGRLATLSGDWIGRPVPITAIVGDQQAATIGQRCLGPGETKATFGTGAFVLTACGTTRARSRSRLLETVLWQDADSRHFALEGSVFTAGSLMQWLRDGMGLLSAVGDSARLAASVADTGGVHIVPAHAGLGAPHWRPDARGAITGLTLGTTAAHVVRAALEAQSHQIADLASAFAADGHPWTRLKVDGGMITNDWLAQDVADVTGLAVERPDFAETTALGAAMLAACGAGLHGALVDAADAMRGPTRWFEPRITADERETRRSLWRAALASVLGTDAEAPDRPVSA